MVAREEMFDPMLAALPSFRPAWEQFLCEWASESDGLPHYVALGSLARHLNRLA